MKIPQFTATESLYRGRSYRSNWQSADSGNNAIVPSIPPCKNCDDILERCHENNWKPRALCNACASNNCNSGQEQEPENNNHRPPWEWWRQFGF
jgi:hypothetical protein